MSKKQETKADGVTLKKDNISFNFTFYEFNCIIVKLADELTTEEKKVTREEARMLLLEDKIEMPQLLRVIDSCTLKYFKEKEFEEAMMKHMKEGK